MIEEAFDGTTQYFFFFRGFLTKRATTEAGPVLVKTAASDNAYQLSSHAIKI